MVLPLSTVYVLFLFGYFTKTCITLFYLLSCNYTVDVKYSIRHSVLLKVALPHNGLRVGGEAGVEGIDAALFGQKNIKIRLFWLHEQTSPASVRLNKNSIHLTYKNRYKYKFSFSLHFAASS